MKRMISAVVALTFIFMLSACGGVESPAASSPATPPSSAQIAESPAEDAKSSSEDGRGDLIEETIPDGAEAIRQGVYYYKLAEFSGDYGDGLSPREGAELVDDLLSSIGFYSDNGGVPAGQCVYISLDELAVLESAMGRECYLYSIGLGTPEGGLMGNDYQVVYRISVDYSGDKTAAVYEDFSSDYSGDGRGDIITDDSEKSHFTLYADFSNGTVETAPKTKEIPLPPRNEMPASNALVAFFLADELSEWTGLDFTLNDVRFDGDSVTVDWSAGSTLISGLGNRTQKEEFHFFDAVSLNWFMMDSLAQTLKHNLDVTTVYYCSDGKSVTFTNPEDMAAQGLSELPTDQPYEGSAFFVAHANNQ